MNSVDPKLLSSPQPLPSHLGQADLKLIEDVFKIEERSACSFIQGHQQLSLETSEGLKTGLRLLRATASYLEEHRDPSLFQRIKRIFNKTLSPFSSSQSPHEKLGDQISELVGLIRYLHKTGTPPGSLISGNLSNLEQVPFEVRDMVRVKALAFQGLIADIGCTVDQILEGQETIDGEGWEKGCLSIRSFYTALFDRAALIKTKSIDLYGRPVRDIDGNIAYAIPSHGIFDVSEQSFLAVVIKHLSRSHQGRHIQRHVEADGLRIGEKISLALHRVFQAISEEGELKIALLEECMARKEYIIEQYVAQSYSSVKDPTLKGEAKKRMAATCRELIKQAIVQEIGSSADRINRLRNPESFKTDFLNTYPQRIANLTNNNPNSQLDNVNLFDHFRNVVSKRRESADTELSYLLKIIEYVGKLSNNEMIADVKRGEKSVEVFPTIFVHPMVTGHPTIQKADIEQLLRDAVGDGCTIPGFPTLTSILINSCIQENQHRENPASKALLLKIESARPLCVNYDQTPYEHLRKFFIHCVGTDQDTHSFPRHTFTRNIDLLRAALLDV